MKKIINVLIISLMLVSNAFAVDMPDLAKKNGCASCHKIDTKLIGPAWIDVSRKYKTDKDAADKLLTKVSKGGSGNWGTMSMPAQDAASKKQDDIKELISFILNLTS